MCIATSDHCYQEQAAPIKTPSSTELQVPLVGYRSSCRPQGAQRVIPIKPCSRSQSKSKSPVLERLPRKVSFGDSSSRTIPSGDSFSTWDKKSLWYNKQELEKLRTKSMMLIFDEGSQLDDDDDEDKDCWRGLEYFVRQEMQRAESESTEQEVCNQIMVYLWRMENHLIEHDEEKWRDLDGMARSMKQEAAEFSAYLAAEDELEAFKIYMEDMDASLVRSCFRC